MRELLDIKGKRKRKELKKREKITNYMKTRNVRVVSQCFLGKLNESWFKVSTAIHGVMG